MNIVLLVVLLALVSTALPFLVWCLQWDRTVRLSGSDVSYSVVIRFFVVSSLIAPSVLGAVAGLSMSIYWLFSEPISAYGVAINKTMSDVTLMTPFMVVFGVLWGIFVGFVPGALAAFLIVLLRTQVGHIRIGPTLLIAVLCSGIAYWGLFGFRLNDWNGLMVLLVCAMPSAFLIRWLRVRLRIAEIFETPQLK